MNSHARSNTVRICTVTCSALAGDMLQNPTSASRASPSVPELTRAISAAAAATTVMPPHWRAAGRCAPADRTPRRPRSASALGCRGSRPRPADRSAPTPPASEIPAGTRLRTRVPAGISDAGGVGADRSAGRGRDPRQPRADADRGRRGVRSAGAHRPAARQCGGMTVVAAAAADIARVNSGTDGLALDADVGFWSMSPASAEQVTVQIRTVLDRAWEFIALAYKGRAFIVLGYPNWDAYVDARFGDLRIAVPREHRAQVVAELAGVRMSCRAIAKMLGVGVATVHRELTRSFPTGPSGSPASDAHDVVVGRDGKEYPRTRRTDPPVVMPCSTCGENHPQSSGDCPWDLSAQGLAPHPHGELMPDLSPAEEATYGMPHRPDPGAACHR